MRGFHLFVAVAVAAAAGSSIVKAQDSDPARAADLAIASEIKNNNQLMKNAEYLADFLGPRLTGSENLAKANRWTEQKFTEYGLDNVHQEPWSLGRSWTRGAAEARIVSPAEHHITLASYGWVAGTRGAVTGPVVYIDPHKPEDFESLKGKLKGAIVIMFKPREFVPPVDAALTPFGDSIIPMNQPKPSFNFRLFNQVYRFLVEEGAAALLMQSDKTHQMLNMFPLHYLGVPGIDLTNITGETTRIGALPAAYVSWEDYNLIWRLLQAGPVQMELNLQNSYSDKPVEVYNTVAEIKGSEKPDEVVILGAHLDSWDLGTGATDNGTGVAVVLEAARALVKTGLKPKRTIRFVLFTGEEEFLLGSRAYLAAHRAELEKISGVLVHDLGTGKVETIALEGDYAAREVMDGVMYSMHDLGLLETSVREVSASDNAAFAQAGVPGFIALQQTLDYSQTHHSQADTFDRIQEPGLTQGAEVLARWAYRVAQLPALLPRQPAQ